MKLLVLGGTLFVGRHLVEVALERGHDVTTFTRGRTNPQLFRGVQALRGDRDGDLTALRGQSWDAVVDTSGYLPRPVRATATLLAGAVDTYCFISSASVYATFSAMGAIEGDATHAPAGASVSTVNAETYGPLKVACEREVLTMFANSTLIIRPGVLVGPHDPSGRLAYWVTRVAEGGEMLAPGDPTHPLQLLDARDLAVWLVDLLEQRVSGTFNATGPDEPLTMSALLETCAEVSGAEVRFVWAPDDFLLEHGVEPWADLPLWLPRDAVGPMLDTRKARATGLRCRSFAETVRDVLRDQAVVSAPASGPARPRTMSRHRERELRRLLARQS